MARLFMISEHSPFMMSFVYITDKDNAVIIDGGNPEDMAELLEIIGDRTISAWILTHPHFDHISGFISEIEKGDVLDRIDKIYYNFPTEEFVLLCEPDIKPCSIVDFNRILPYIKTKSVIVTPELNIRIDELTIDFLFCGGERYKKCNPNMAVNESSIVFKVTGDNMKSVLFLGDLGPNGGRDLIKNCCDRIKSDFVQMSHHGHCGVTDEVYEIVSPEACLWCAPEWLYNEDDIEFEPELWGTWHQRKLMEKLGVKQNFVSKDGTQEIPLRSV